MTGSTERSGGVAEARPGADVAVIALGANLGEPDRALRRAAAALARLGRVTAASDVYLTEPIGGPLGQPAYRNAVLVMRPAPAWGSPERLLHALLALEAAAGRLRRERWGPRVLDLDLVSFGSEERRAPDLVLPHPEATGRAFVMIPLAQAWPGWRAPDGRTARTIAGESSDAGVLRTDVPLWP